MTTEPTLPERFAAAMHDLLVHPLDAVTRQRQTMLLVSSVLTLLVKLSILTPSGSYGGLTIGSVDREVAAMILSVVTGYAVIIYGLSVWSDMTMAGFRRQGPATRLQKIVDELQEEQNADIARNEEIGAEMFARWEEQQAVRAKYEAERKAIDVERETTKRKIQEIDAPFHALPTEQQLEAWHDYQAAHRPLWQRSEELFNRYIATYDACDAELRERHLHADQTPEFRELDHHIERFDTVNRLLRRHKRISAFRNAFEVILPILLGIFAVVIANIPDAQLPW